MVSNCYTVKEVTSSKAQYYLVLKTVAYKSNIVMDVYERYELGSGTLVQVVEKKVVEKTYCGGKLKTKREYVKTEEVSKTPIILVKHEIGVTETGST